MPTDDDHIYDYEHQVSIRDEHRGTSARITSDGAIEVAVHAHPVQGEVSTLIPTVELMSTPAGVTDMNVDGGTNPVVFEINAEFEYTKYIKRLIITIADAGATLNEFGNLPALTNGCTLHWISQLQGQLDISTGLKTNFDLVILGGGSPAIGGGNDAFRANNISGSSEGYVGVYDFTESHGFPWGLPLQKGTKDRLCFIINDDITAIDRLDVRALGFKI